MLHQPGTDLNSGFGVRYYWFGWCRKTVRVLAMVLRGIMELSLNTHTYTELIMSTKTISITEEAYERLKNLKKDEKTSFSDVIIAHYPKRKKLSEVLKEIGANPELADSIETVSREMRKARLREVRF